MEKVPTLPEIRKNYNEISKLMHLESQIRFVFVIDIVVTKTAARKYSPRTQ